MKEEDIRKIIREELESFEDSELNEGAKNWAKKAWTGVKNTGRAIGREAKETVTAAKILMKMLRGSEISSDEVRFLKAQSADLVKALALIGLQAIPGSSAGIIALEKIAKSKGFTIFPKAQESPNKKK